MLERGSNFSNTSSLLNQKCLRICSVNEQASRIIKCFWRWLSFGSIVKPGEKVWTEITKLLILNGRESVWLWTVLHLYLSWQKNCAFLYCVLSFKIPLLHTGEFCVQSKANEGLHGCSEEQLSVCYPKEVLLGAGWHAIMTERKNLAAMQRTRLISSYCKMQCGLAAMFLSN